MKVDELLNELKAIKMKHKGGLLSFLEEQEAERIIAYEEKSLEHADSVNSLLVTN